MLFGYEKENLITLPTPTQRLNGISELTGCDCWIKRDDMTDWGMGGNKLRKLEYLLTYGGAQTNHGRLTAAVAARYGMKCAILCPDQHPDQVNGNILLDRIMGAEVYVQDGGSIKELSQKVIAQYEAAGGKVYEIPVGGSNTVGLRGYFACAGELKTQLDQLGWQPDYIVCAAGSLGTYLGLWMGARTSKNG